MFKTSLLVLTAFFRFYFFLITRQKEKMYKLLMNRQQQVSTAVTPLFVNIILCFFLYDFQILHLPLGILSTLANMFYVEASARRAHEIEMERINREWRAKEYEREKIRQQNAQRQHNAQRKQTTDSMANAMKLMGLSDGFTAKDVKSAYRRLSKIHHPDVGGTQTNFIKLQKAYKYIVDNT